MISTIEKLTDDNFLIYAAKHYDNPQCHSTEEFLEDLKRLKYIKKLLTRYVDSGELKERLILNHLIVLNNVLGPEHLCRILYLKMKKQFGQVMPFLVLLNVLPNRVYNIRNETTVDMAMITMDQGIIDRLRKI
jgi:hypothetical protein